MGCGVLGPPRSRARSGLASCGEGCGALVGFGVGAVGLGLVAGVVGGLLGDFGEGRWVRGFRIFWGYGACCVVGLRYPRSLFL